METEPLDNNVEIGRIGARTFATGALVQMLIMFLFWICLALLVGSGNGFTVTVAGHDSYFVISSEGMGEILPAFLVTGIIYAVVHFVAGFRIGRAIWGRNGQFLLPSLFGVLCIALIVGGLSHLTLGNSTELLPIFSKIFALVTFVFPSFLTALLSGWVCKQWLLDFAQKRGISWPQDSN